MSWSLFMNKILATHKPHAQETIEESEVNGNQAGNNMEMIDMNHQDLVGNSSSSSVGNKQRKKQSKVWEEMTKFTGEEDGRDWARCNHCQKLFDGSSKKGTTHLNNHLQRCPRKRNNGAGDNADKPMDQTTNLTSSVAIEEKSVTDLIKSCFDERGRLTECWDPSVLNSRRVEILQIYEEQKEELRRVFSQLTCRFSLVIELYFGYYVLSIYYIDNSWERKMKIISICATNKDEELHHNYQNLVKILKESCSDLKKDRNICSIVYHGRTTSHFVKGDHEDSIGEINSWFNHRGNSLPYVGCLFSVKIVYLFCSEFEKNWAEWLWRTFGGLRKCIHYVNSTYICMRNFQIAVDNVKSMGKKVKISDLFPILFDKDISDVGDAVGYKEAFLELERIDSDFKSRSINLTEEQWDEATVIYQHSTELLDSFKSWVESKYTTLNQHFPKFCDVYMKLLSLRQRTQSYHLDKETSTLIEKLSSELEKYNLVLVIAVILDPRFKVDIVQLWYNKIYGRDADRYLEKIIDDFNKYYEMLSSESGNTTSSYLDTMGRPCKSSPKSSELERYLNDPKVPSVEEFDILAWWRAYTPIFPTLAKMARDILALPIYYFSPFHLNSYTDTCIFYCEDLDDDIKPALLYLKKWLESHEK
ncbi:zinc finger BED domain-containing protein RICESLEEPER 1-like [Melia azedarach]|uniref:Zinc finger BED domain-containing protein RICESLEEPER 1-like n=1 Tax=Melia azedarach TaxID=155640 RepID=A0ACC1YI72_MELAZ|nr:zinc finger BED domain-containing protein RICESLEEPER 1-like [Melia azedarach]